MCVVYHVPVMLLQAIFSLYLYLIAPVYVTITTIQLDSGLACLIVTEGRTYLGAYIGLGSCFVPFGLTALLFIQKCLMESIFVEMSGVQLYV